MAVVFIPGQSGVVIETPAPTARHLEVSSRSPEAEGRALSAMYLRMFGGRTVEALYQGSKVFANGGPYALTSESSGFEAKAYARRMSCGTPLVGFKLPFCTSFEGKLISFKHSVEVYDFLYLSALSTNPELEEFVERYDSFSDCFYSPKMYACQARSCALHVALRRSGVEEPWRWAMERLERLIE